MQRTGQLQHSIRDVSSTHYTVTLRCGHTDFNGCSAFQNSNKTGAEKSFASGSLWNTVQTSACNLGWIHSPACTWSSALSAWANLLPLLSVVGTTITQSLWDVFWVMQVRSTLVVRLSDIQPIHKKTIIPQHTKATRDNSSRVFWSLPEVKIAKRCVLPWDTQIWTARGTEGNLPIHQKSIQGPSYLAGFVTQLITPWSSPPTSPDPSLKWQFPGIASAVRTLPQCAGELSVNSPSFFQRCPSPCTLQTKSYTPVQAGSMTALTSTVSGISSGWITWKSFY